jgi:hypothetical protein
MAFAIDYAHDLGQDEARNRIKALGEYLTNKHGIAVSWENDDRAKISGKYMIVTIEGTVSVEPKTVRFEGKDPGMLWRGKAKDYLTHKLAKYLDPKTQVADLPRR